MLISELFGLHFNKVADVELTCWVRKKSFLLFQTYAVGRISVFADGSGPKGLTFVTII